MCKRNANESFKKYQIRRFRENTAIRIKLRVGRWFYKTTSESRPHMQAGARPYIIDAQKRKVLHARMGFR